MKNWILAVVVLVVVAAGGGYLLLHKSTPKNTLSSKNTATTSTINNAVVMTKTNATLGQYLTDTSGKALYTYKADTSGVSNCTGSCLQSWPAYIDKGSTSNLLSGISTIKRTDNGENQYTYNGSPLYYFVNDSAGQVTGNGVQNFSVAKPASSTSTSSSSQSTGTTYNSTSSW